MARVRVMDFTQFLWQISIWLLAFVSLRHLILLAFFLLSLQMTSQSVDIFSMLNKAQTEYNQQQNSVAAFFRQASSNGNHNNNNGPTMRSMPLPINNMPMHSLSSLEQIERQIRTSPPSNRK